MNIKNVFYVPFPSQSRNVFGTLFGFTREDFGLFIVRVDGD